MNYFQNDGSLCGYLYFNSNFLHENELFKVAQRGLDIPIFGILLQLHQ